MDRTDHSTAIALLRTRAEQLKSDRDTQLAMEVAADLLELHDDTGISLDAWASAREMVERFIGQPITPNGC